MVFMFIITKWAFSDYFFPLVCYFAHTREGTKRTKFQGPAWVKILENMPCAEHSRKLVEAGRSSSWCLTLSTDV